MRQWSLRYGTQQGKRGTKAWLPCITEVLLLPSSSMISPVMYDAFPYWFTRINMHVQHESKLFWRIFPSIWLRMIKAQMLVLPVIFFKKKINVSMKCSRIFFILLTSFSLFSATQVQLLKERFWRLHLVLRGGVWGRRAGFSFQFFYIFLLGLCWLNTFFFWNIGVICMG